MSYLTHLLKAETLKNSVQLLEENLATTNWNFDTIAVRGVSGMLVGIPLSIALGKDLIISRKSLKGSHSDELVEGAGSGQRVLIVDDMIFTGSTLNAIHKDLTEFCTDAVVVGILLYGSFGLHSHCEVFEFKDGVRVPVISLKIE